MLSGNRVLLRNAGWSRERLDRFKEDVFVGGFERRFRFRQSVLSTLAGFLESENVDLNRENMLASTGSCEYIEQCRIGYAAGNIVKMALLLGRGRQIG